MPKPITVLLAGANGVQAGMIARSFLERDDRARALQKQPFRQAVANQATPAGGEELGDQASPREAARVADALFLMAAPFEHRMASEAGDGARSTQVTAQSSPRAASASTVGSPRMRPAPCIERHEVEAYIEGLGVPYTIIAPAFFMERILGLRSLRAGRLSLPLPPTLELQLVAVADIAGFVRLVAERPSLFRGKRIDVAADSLTGQDMASILSRTPGGLAELSLAAVDEAGAESEELARMFEWLDRVGYSADMPVLVRDYREVGWRDFIGWSREQAWSVLRHDHRAELMT